MNNTIKLNLKPQQTEQNMSIDSFAAAYSLIIESMSLISGDFLLFSAEGRLLAMSSKLQSSPAGKLLEQKLDVIDFSFLSSQNASAIKSQIENSIAENQAFESTFFNTSQENKPPVEFHLSSKILHNADGKPALFLIIIQNQISKLDLKPYNERNHKLQQVGALSAGLFHDTRNYMQNLYSSIQLAQLKAKAYPEISKALQAVNDDFLIIMDLITNFSNFAAEKRTAELIDVSNLCQKSYKFMRNLANSRQIKLTLNNSEDIPQTYAYFSKLQQVIVNLVMNAMDAIADKREFLSASTEAEFFEPKIVIKCSAKVNGFVISVQDNGIGMSIETLKGLKNPFFTTKRLGTGMGIGICRGILADHGGKLEISSTYSKGSVFTAHLPLCHTLKQLENYSSRPTEDQVN